MLEEFIKDIEKLYKDIDIYKDKKLVDNFKEKWDIKSSIGDFYENISLKENRKQKGSFYTPFDIVNHMSLELVKKIDKNRKYDIKVLDPSCGGGYFLINLYNSLNSLFKQADFKNKEKYIIENVLYGYDVDDIAVLITIIELFYLSGYISKNIYNKDFLFEKEEERKYNYIVGNPPYVGHKLLDKEYRKNLCSIYNEVFYDKGDLSYCFFKKSIKSLKDKGELYFFTSRYILESLYGKGIREYILENCTINSIIDFYGVRVVKGAGVDNIIINFSKGKNNSDIKYFRVILEGKDKGKEVFNDITLNERKYTKLIKVNSKSLLSSGWNFLSNNEKNILEKIKAKCDFKLKDICESFQGIITGRDEAFIITKEQSQSLSINNDILKLWLKGKQVEKFNIASSNKLIIYTDLIKDEVEYSNTLDYLIKYKNKLENRRECKKGLRKWYSIQWGRKEEYFKGKKIIFPYKSSSNRFAIDIGSYFSADIYGILIKENTQFYTYEFLECILNSRIYEFYIKTIAKKLGDNLYEYYPNKIMEVYIPSVIEEINNIGRGTKDSIEYIDSILINYFGLTNKEFEVVKSWCM